MQLITGSCPQIKSAGGINRTSRLHGKKIRIELIRALIGTFKDRIVEIKIELHDRIRNLHLKDRLMHLHQFTFICPVDLNSRVEILGQQRLGKCGSCR